MLSLMANQLSEKKISSFKNQLFHIVKTYLFNTCKHTEGELLLKTMAVRNKGLSASKVYVRS